MQGMNQSVRRMKLYNRIEMKPSIIYSYYVTRARVTDANLDVQSFKVDLT